MKKIKIFLGSSIIEFEKERNDLELFIRNVSDRFEDKYNIKILPLRCENMDNYVRKDGTQSAINEELVLGSDMCFFIFFTKAGEFTEEEFRIAFEKFKKDGKPKIYIYFKNIPEGQTVEESVHNFMSKIDNELKHYHGSFDHIDTIKLRILLNLKLQEMDFVSVEFKNGNCVVDGKETLDLSNVSEFANNNILQQLQKELAEVEEYYFQMKPIYDKGNVSDAFYKEYAEVSSKRQNLIDAVEELQKNIFNMSLRICKDEVHGDITIRQKEAYRLFELGDYEGAMSVLDAEEINNDFFRKRKLLQEMQKKESQRFIREHKTAIDILMTMISYQNRFNDIKQRYEMIIPIIEEDLVEVELIYDYIVFLYNRKNLFECLDTIIAFVSLLANEVPQNLENTIGSLLDGIIINCKWNRSIEEFLIIGDKIKAIAEMNTKFYGYMQICYGEIARRYEKKGDLEKAIAFLKRGYNLENENTSTKSSSDTGYYHNFYKTLLNRKDEYDNFYQYLKENRNDWKNSSRNEIFSSLLKKLERKNYPSIDSSYYCEWLSKDFLHWKIEGEILYIYGKGAMRDYRFYCSGEDDIEPPWYKKKGIKTVIIKEGVTYIGDYAFAYNKDIISINLPSTVVNMGESVFIGCDNLSSINVDKNNKVYISKNGVLYTYAMDEIIYCPSKSISETCLFPYGLERIGIQAFSNCKNLRFLNIVETVNYIDAGAFENCFNLEYVNIPSGIKEIRINAFHHCEKLKNIQLPKTVEKIDFGAFSTSGLIEIDIPAIDVCNCAFAGCKNLQKVRFSNKTEAILYNAFYFCMSLEEITLSRSINYIDPEAFELCVNLKNILFDGSKEDWDKKEYSMLFPKEKYNIIFLKSEM